MISLLSTSRRRVWRCYGRYVQINRLQFVISLEIVDRDIFFWSGWRSTRLDERTVSRQKGEYFRSTADRYAQNLKMITRSERLQSARITFKAYIDCISVGRIWEHPMESLCGSRQMSCLKYSSPSSTNRTYPISRWRICRGIDLHVLSMWRDTDCYL